MKKPFLIPVPVAAAAVLFCGAASGSSSILLEAQNFTLLGGTALTNTEGSDTMIRGGNAGLFNATSAAVAGFSEANLEAGYELLYQGATGSAGADLMKTRQGLLGMDGEEFVGVFGAENLSPGVYTFSAATALQGTLTLDGGGQDNVFWVFQIKAAFDTLAGTEVRLINAGSNVGIFWIADGITFGADNVILGNYISTSTITSGLGTTGDGRLLAESAITINGNRIDASNDYWSGALMYAGDGTTVIPEPSTYAILFGLAALGFVVVRRTRANAKT